MSCNTITPGEKKFFQLFVLETWKLQRSDLFSLKKLGFFSCSEKLLQTLQRHTVFHRSVEFTAIKEYWRETWWDHNSLAISCSKYIKLYNTTFSSIWSSAHFSRFLKTAALKSFLFEDTSIFDIKTWTQACCAFVYLLYLSFIDLLHLPKILLSID